MKNLICSINGHNLKIVKNVTVYVKEYQCKHCNEKFTTSQSGQVIPLTKEREDINAILGRIHLRKANRRKIPINYRY